MAEQKKVTGFVHNLSPTRNGASKIYFDFILQTNATSSIRGVCFSPQKRKLFADAENQARPIKIQKFVEDKKDGSTDILMNVVDLELMKQDDVGFERKDIVPSDLNLSMLSLLSAQQLISLRAKVINLKNPENVTTAQFSLDKADATLVDGFGTVKITLWGNDIAKVKNGNTYYFTNLRLKKNRMNGELYVNLAQGNSSIEECEPLPKTLNIPEDVPVELTSHNVNAEIIGVTDVKLDYACCKCNKPVQPKKITKCEKCNLMQKLDRCKKSWYVRSLIELENGSSVYLIFRDKAVDDIVKISACTQDLSEEALTEMFLMAPKLNLSYDNKNVVQQVCTF